MDKRTDIWAFGCVLYELLTGKQAFHGEDVTDILAAVLKSEPDWSRTAREHLSSHSRSAATAACGKTGVSDHRMRRFFGSRLKMRLRHRKIPVQRRLLQLPRASCRGQWPQHWQSSLSSRLWVVWRATRPVEQALRPLVRLDVDLGPDVSLGSPRGTDAILSPDGTRIVYVSQGRLFTRRLDQPNATELAGTQGAYAPFFSPDGQWVAFFTARKAAKDFGGGRLGNHLVQRKQWCGRQLGRGWQHHRGAQHHRAAYRGFLPPEVRQRQ